jgi:hypothetical protein
MAVHFLGAQTHWEWANPVDTEVGTTSNLAPPPAVGDVFVLEGSAALAAAGNSPWLTISGGLSYQSVFAYGPDDTVCYEEAGPQYLFDFGKGTRVLDLSPTGMLTIFGAQLDPTLSIIDAPGASSQVRMVATWDGHGGTYLTRPGWNLPGLNSPAAVHLVYDPVSSAVAHGL